MGSILPLKFVTRARQALKTIFLFNSIDTLLAASAGERPT
jgi:hypothetical protein